MLDLAPIKRIWNPEDLSQPVSIGQAFRDIPALIAEVELQRGYGELRTQDFRQAQDDRDRLIAEVESLRDELMHAAADNALLLKTVEATGCECDEPDVCFSDQLRKAALNVKHPGSLILARLAKLDAVAEAAKSYPNYQPDEWPDGAPPEVWIPAVNAFDIRLQGALEALDQAVLSG